MVGWDGLPHGMVLVPALDYKPLLRLGGGGLGEIVFHFLPEIKNPPFPAYAWWQHWVRLPTVWSLFLHAINPRISSSALWMWFGGFHEEEAPIYSRKY